MILLDTNILLFDALFPERLSIKALKILESEQSFACAGISLFEIAMLIAKKRIIVSLDTERFIKAVLAARNIEVLPMNAEIAAISQNLGIDHKDPADLMIAATALFHKAVLLSSDRILGKIKQLEVIW